MVLLPEFECRSHRKVDSWWLNHCRLSWSLCVMHCSVVLHLNHIALIRSQTFLGLVDGKLQLVERPDERGEEKEDAINRERLGLKFMEPIQVLIPNSQTLGFNLAGAWVGEGATVVSPVYNVRYAEESAEIAVVEDGDDMVDAAFMTDKLRQMTSKTYVAFEKHGECSPEFPTSRYTASPSRSPHT